MKTNTNQDLKKISSIAAHKPEDKKMDKNEFKNMLPWQALTFCADKLTQEQFDACVEKEPGIALEFCADKLTQAQFDVCVEERPLYALEFCANKLTQEQFDACVENSPMGMRSNFARTK